MFGFWKNCSESFKRSFLVVIAYGLAFGLGYLTRLYNPNINIPFYISEQEKIVYYHLKLKDLLDLLFIGPIFTVTAFILLKRILDQLKPQSLSENKIIIFYALFLLAAVLYNYGNAIHVTMNRLNAQIVDEHNSEDFYYQVYYEDNMMSNSFYYMVHFLY